MKKDFNEYRFAGFEFENQSNNYWKFASQVNNDETKILVKVNPENMFTFLSGYSKWEMTCLKLDRNHCVYLKAWQVFKGGNGTYIVIDKNYWNIKEAKEPFDDMVEEADNSWEAMLETAKKQQTTDNILVKKA